MEIFLNAQRAPITRLLLLVNVLIYLLEVTVFSDRLSSIFFSFGLSPAQFWAGRGWWMPITSLFLHAQMPLHLHIIFNMIALWSLGTPMEMTLGSNRFAWLYGVSGMGGALAVLLWHFVAPMTNPTVGASGAIFGLLGALAVFYPNSPMLFFFIPMKARTVVVLVIGLSVVLMVTDLFPIISHAGHLGGLVAGLLYARFALGLPLARNVLFSKAGPEPYFAGAARTPSSEQAAREAVQRFFRTEIIEQSEPRNVPGSRPPEKIINPDPGTWSDPAAQTPGAENVPAPDAPAPPERESPQAPSGKRLHFDPETGRFFFK